MLDTFHDPLIVQAVPLKLHHATIWAPDPQVAAHPAVPAFPADVALEAVPAIADVPAFPADVALTAVPACPAEEAYPALEAELANTAVPDLPDVVA